LRENSLEGRNAQEGKGPALAARSDTVARPASVARLMTVVRLEPSQDGVDTRMQWNNPLKSRPHASAGPARDWFSRTTQGHERMELVTATDTVSVQNPEGAKDTRGTGPGSDVGGNGLWMVARP